MDRVAELAARIQALGAGESEGNAKVELIVELEDQIADPRALALFVSLIADPTEFDLARIECVKILRLYPPPDPADRRLVGRTIGAVLASDEDYLVRQYAAASLGGYTDDVIVFEALTTAVLHDDDIDVRHNALTSVEEAGPSDRGIALLRRLDGDPELGVGAARRLREWVAGGPVIGHHD